MEHLKMQTTNIVDENIKRIGELFPDCLTERLDENGKPEMAIDFDQLRQELSKSIVEGPTERYQFTWPDKRNAIRLANAPTTDTLRPCREESVNFDTTQNLYIEGDNLQVLKLLRENYLGKVKMIYIDPPYNTGNDFVYNDDFAQDASEYVHNSGQTDEEGNRLVTNTESNGRFHTDWLNMIYPRLKVSRDLLSDNGVIFMSIDDNEVENLKKLCDEIFGSQFFVAQIALVNNIAGRSDSTHVATAHEYILMYTKSNSFVSGGLPLSAELLAEYKYEDEIGKYRLQGLRKRGTNSRREDRPNLYYPFYYHIKNKELSTEPCDGAIEIYPHLSDGADGNWRWGKDSAKSKISFLEARIVSTRNEYDIFEKVYLNSPEGERTTKLKSFLLDSKYTTDTATTDYRSLMPAKSFTSPKSVFLLETLCRVANTSCNSIILDFFSGSATTAHAVMQLNAEDGGNRKFIMVQLPEATDEKSEAYRAGYKNICEIGKERIRRAGKQIVNEMQSHADALESDIKRMLSARPDKTTQLLLLDQIKETAENIYKEQILPKQKELDDLREKIDNLDTGFRVLKLDSSNMNDVFYRPEDFNDQLIKDDNIKADRTSEDLLFQVMLECNLPLSAKIETEKISGKEVFSVNDGYLIACFDEKVDENVIKEIAKRKPYYFVMRDSSLSSDNVADNFDQIFQAYSKDTIRRVL